ncbi:MAG: flagellar motor protein MotB [Candidatus Marinimicrobia bacterium]|nr:flagellar motor protein MotB [Candidatus Neomarinimicrobiota bacterium]MCF7828853.1 flagellar motor protein MotB [Candidatus Neomarinimicrobiota bacterium]MCF7880770.1 flagellar motor protein MotB [Candidatus Neomarinimicrobiota bacterium]
MSASNTSQNRRTPVTRKRASRSVWLITYADMVTVLLTFFVMIFIYMKEAENSIDRWLDQLMNQTYAELTRYVDQNEIRGLEIERVTKGIRIILSSGVMFDPGYAELKQKIRPVISEVGSVIDNSTLIHIEDNPQYSELIHNLRQQNRDLKVDIRVEGHTDSDPYVGREFESNWELSAARALAVVKYMAASTGLSESKFSALGYGEYRPILSNDSEENKQRNRRVEVYLDANLVQNGGEHVVDRLND